MIKIGKAIYRPLGELSTSFTKEVSTEVHRKLEYKLRINGKRIRLRKRNILKQIICVHKTNRGTLNEVCKWITANNKGIR